MNVFGVPQLPLCTLVEGNDDPIPFGSIAYFWNQPACPLNWTPLAVANGRSLIPGFNAGSPIASPSAPLASGEDRQHSHR
jgi:hypothetical protein